MSKEYDEAPFEEVEYYFKTYAGLEKFTSVRKVGDGFHEAATPTGKRYRFDEEKKKFIELFP